eukprot:TRINITY_DN7412_c0_g1_i1.p1 TRINITY_DN7412_c0_g1~~TRINITY_DN7412_c0_g1_i1.p1  ORF type:complete len:456 (+),score=81.50 TRINITY_DN7412_c0_g1_i1:1241-2608(+)
MDELSFALICLKGNSSPGPDGVNNKSMHIYLKNPTFIDTLKDATITTLFKKGDRRVLENYRGISLLNSIFKLITGIVNRRKTRLKEMSGAYSDSQGGGRPGRSIGMKVLNIINLVQMAKQQGKNPILIRFDLVKAYDKINFKGILDAFTVLNYGQDYIEFYKEAYLNIRSKVKTYHGLTSNIFSGESLAHGDNGSPSTFDDFMELLIRRLEQCKITIILCKKLNFFKEKMMEVHGIEAWLDDILLIVDKEHAQKACDLTLGKTEAIHFYEGIQENILINQVNKPQAIVNSIPDNQAMRVLGYWITKDFSWNEHIRILTNKALEKMEVVKNANIRFKDKAKLVNSDVISIISYSMDIVPFNNLQMLQRSIIKGLYHKKIAKDTSQYIVSSTKDSLIQNLQILNDAKMIAGFAKTLNGIDTRSKYLMKVMYDTISCNISDGKDYFHSDGYYRSKQWS